MKILSSFLFSLPMLGFAQESQTTLEVQMFNHNQVVVSIDGKQFNACSKLKLTDLNAGNHKIQVFIPKDYVNPSNNKVSHRLIPIYSGSIYLADDKKTNCTINEFHEKEIVIG